MFSASIFAFFNLNINKINKLLHLKIRKVKFNIKMKLLEVSLSNMCRLVSVVITFRQVVLMALLITFRCELSSAALMLGKSTSLHREGEPNQG